MQRPNVTISYGRAKFAAFRNTLLVAVVSSITIFFLAGSELIIYGAHKPQLSEVWFYNTVL